MKAGDLALRAGILALAGLAAWLVLREPPPRDPLHVDVASSRDDALRILFVGNSHTFVNDLPGTFGSLAHAGDPGRGLVVKDVVAGGVDLAWHLQNGEAAKAIRAERWDWVVLQEQSLEPTYAPALYEQSVRSFDAIIRAAGAKTAIYELWPRREGQDPAALDAIYRRVADEVHALLVPVGPAWLRAERGDPSLVLYKPDGYHPSRAGTYLAACVFYEALLGREAAGLPDLAMVAPRAARELQRAARGRGPYAEDHSK